MSKWWRYCTLTIDRDAELTWDELTWLERAHQVATRTWNYFAR